MQYRTVFNMNKSSF